jgi:hypothetical protein
MDPVLAQHFLLWNVKLRRNFLLLCTHTGCFIADVNLGKPYWSHWNVGPRCLGSAFFPLNTFSKFLHINFKDLHCLMLNFWMSSNVHFAFWSLFLITSTLSGATYFFGVAFSSICIWSQVYFFILCTILSVLCTKFLHTILRDLCTIFSWIMCT